MVNAQKNFNKQISDLSLIRLPTFISTLTLTCIVLPFAPADPDPETTWTTVAPEFPFELDLAAMSSASPAALVVIQYCSEMSRKFFVLLSLTIKVKSEA